MKVCGSRPTVLWKPQPGSRLLTGAALRGESHRRWGLLYPPTGLQLTHGLGVRTVEAVCLSVYADDRDTASIKGKSMSVFICVCACVFGKEGEILGRSCRSLLLGERIAGPQSKDNDIHLRLVQHPLFSSLHYSVMDTEWHNNTMHFSYCPV